MNAIQISQWGLFLFEDNWHAVNVLYVAERISAFDETRPCVVRSFKGFDPIVLTPGSRNFHRGNKRP